MAAQALVDVADLIERDAGVPARLALPTGGRQAMNGTGLEAAVGVAASSHRASDMALTTKVLAVAESEGGRRGKQRRRRDGS